MELVVEEGFDAESVAAGFDSVEVDFDSEAFESAAFESPAAVVSPAGLSADEALPDDLGA